VKQVLFLCTGNYYRSRFAEALFNHLAETRRSPWRATSRGLALTPLNVGPISLHTLEALAARGVDTRHTGATPRALSQTDLDAADRIIALDREEHLPLMQRVLPSEIARTEFWSVPDVDRLSPDIALLRIETDVRRLLDRLS
jgi:protein-tyrosine phosphatase